MPQIINHNGQWYEIEDDGVMRPYNPDNTDQKPFMDALGRGDRSDLNAGIESKFQVINPGLEGEYAKFGRLADQFGSGERQVDARKALYNAGDLTNQNRALGAYGRQEGSVDMARQAAEGNVPSVAELQGRKQLDQSMQQNIGLARSGGGASGMRAALYANAKAGQGGVADAASMRAQEMAAARGQYMQGAQGLSGTAANIRSQGMQAAGMDINSQEASRAREMQRQSAQMAAHGNILSAKTQARGTAIQSQLGKDNANTAMGMNIGAGLLQAGATAAPHIGKAIADSDPIVKQNIFPAGFSPSGIDMKTGFQPAGQLTPESLTQGGQGSMRAMAMSAAGEDHAQKLKTAPGWEPPQNQKDILRDALTKAGPDMNTVNKVGSLSGAGSKANDLSLGYAKAAFRPAGEMIGAVQGAGQLSKWMPDFAGGKAPQAIRDFQQLGKTLENPDKWIDTKGLEPTGKDVIKGAQGVLGQMGTPGELAGGFLPDVAAGKSIEEMASPMNMAKAAPTVMKAAGAAPVAGSAGAAGAAAAGGGGGAGAAFLSVLPFLSDPRAKMNAQPANFLDRITSAIDSKSGLLPAGMAHAPWGGKEAPSLGGPESIKTGIMPASAAPPGSPVGLPPGLLGMGMLPWGPNASQSLGGPASIKTNMQAARSPLFNPLSNFEGNRGFAGTVSDQELHDQMRGTVMREGEIRMGDDLVQKAKQYRPNDYDPTDQNEAQTQVALDRAFRLNRQNQSNAGQPEPTAEPSKTPMSPMAAASKPNESPEDKKKREELEAKGGKAQAFGDALSAFAGYMGKASQPYQTQPQAYSQYPTYKLGDFMQSDERSKENKSQAGSPIRDFEEKAKGFTYQYKSPEFEDGTAPPGTTHLGPMADDLRAVKGGIGETLTYKDPNTGLLGVNTGRLSLANTAAVNDLHERIKQLETKRRGGK